MREDLVSECHKAEIEYWSGNPYVPYCSVCGFETKPIWVKVIE